MRAGDLTPVVPKLVLDHLDILMCPVCSGSLRVGDDLDRTECTACGRSFGCDRGIPLLFWPTEWTAKTDVTDIVRAFYEETPFPNYDDMDSPESLRTKAEQGLFARLLNDQIPHGSKILEVGCGTGQLSNFLGLTWGRSVFASDLCLNSLKLANSFKQQHDIQSVCFVQMNLFRTAFRPESVDFVISNGVLHHTSDPFLAFRTILTCLKKGGFIIVGLYNTYGRLTTDIRRLIFRATGDRFRFLDPRLRTKTVSGLRKQAWFKDQYKHPHESKHSFREVLRWFGNSGVEFISSIPRCTVGDSFAREEMLFEPRPEGSALDHFLVQLGMLLGGGREGGFFIMIGRKKA
jgi:SAM-dependent methyltransferase